MQQSEPREFGSQDAGMERDLDAALEELMATGPLPAPVDPWSLPAPSAEPIPEPLPIAFDRTPPKRRIRRRFWRDVCIGGLLVALTHVFLVQVSVVRGLSMSPSLSDGDRLVVDRLSYSLSDVSRFDVVVLRYPKDPDVDFVKRVVGLPGDRVELRHGVLSVNGTPISEGFAHINDVHARGEWVVPVDSFFVLGDNRPISCDSREFGMVRRSFLKGRVRAIFWPLDRFALL